MAQNKFQLTLPSKSSMSTYANNSASRYTTKLCRPITLDGDWEAALMEVQFPGTWFRLASPECFLVYLLPDDESISKKVGNSIHYALDDIMYSYNLSKTAAGNLYNTKASYTPFDLSRMRSMFIVQAGGYESPKALFNKINQGFRNMLTYGYTDRTKLLSEINVKYYYDKKSNRVTISHPGFKAMQIVAQNPVLLSRLGMKLIKVVNHKKAGDLDADRVVYVFDGFNLRHPNKQPVIDESSLHIHSNIIRYQQVGSTQAQLLATVPPTHAYGSQESWSANPPLYLPLSVNYLDNIEIWIENDKEEPYPFESEDRVIVRLDCRRRPLSI